MTLHWTFYLAVVYLLVFSYYYLGLVKARRYLDKTLAFEGERQKALQDLLEWEQGLVARIERGDLTVGEALNELTELKLTRLKVLSVPR